MRTVRKVPTGSLNTCTGSAQLVVRESANGHGVPALQQVVAAKVTGRRGRLLARRGREQPVLEREQGGADAGGDADLRVHVLDVVIGGLGRHDQRFGDLAR